MKDEVKTRKDFDIDLVYTWVDGNDAEWRRRRDAVSGKPDERVGENCEGRYADNDELKYSLRSAELYAPWIRRIHIVTDRQVPAWLNTDHPKINIVDHSEILPAEVLPTFNSNVIEHALHRIPGLAERFLYANDDMFFNREVTPADFFTSAGLPIVRMIHRPVRRFTLWLKKYIQRKPISHYNQALHNAAKLIESKFGKYIGSKPHHNIDAYSKSEYNHCYNLFEKEISPTLTNHIRNDNDVQRVIYSYLPIVEKKCRMVFADRQTSFRLHTHRHHHYGKLERCSPMLFCINDSEYAGAADREFAKKFLSCRFPNKSSFEK